MNIYSFLMGEIALHFSSNKEECLFFSLNEVKYFICSKVVNMKTKRT